MKVTSGFTDFTWLVQLGRGQSGAFTDLVKSYLATPPLTDTP